MTICLKNIEVRVAFSISLYIKMVDWAQKAWWSRKAHRPDGVTPVLSGGISKKSRAKCCKRLVGKFDPLTEEAKAEINQSLKTLQSVFLCSKFLKSTKWNLVWIALALKCCPQLYISSFKLIYIGLVILFQVQYTSRTFDNNSNRVSILISCYWNVLHILHFFNMAEVCQGPSKGLTAYQRNVLPFKWYKGI